MKRITSYTHSNPDPDEQQTDTAPGPYFVSVTDAGRLGLLAGPYDHHADALAEIERVKTLAIEADRRAHFYQFGTVRMKPGTYKTVFAKATA